MKKAIITGIAGQDGSYLADLLLSKGYEVHGIVRSINDKVDSPQNNNIQHLLDKIYLHDTALDDPIALGKLVKDVTPNEFYHLASSSFVNYTFNEEFSTFNNNVQSTHVLLDVLKEYALDCRIYYAGSSEMFGRVESEPQNENTPFNPRSLYGISKLTGYHLVKNYRELYNMFISTGILYNHESPRRGIEFVTRKITSTVAKIKLGMDKKIYLGNLDSLRDWGYAPEYVYAMWLMLQNNKPDDYVIATGKLHSVRDFVEHAFNFVGLDYKQYVVTDPKYYREAEKIPLRGNSNKAKKELDWSSNREFKEIIEEMVTHDIKLLGECEAEVRNETTI